MNTNHHIAMQLAAERQRDLRAAGGGWSFADLFGRRSNRLASGRASEDAVPARASDAALPAGLGSDARLRPEPRLRRVGTSPGPHRVSASGAQRARRRAERMRSS